MKEPLQGKMQLSSAPNSGKPDQDGISRNREMGTLFKKSRNDSWPGRYLIGRYKERLGAPYKKCYKNDEVE